MAHRKVSRNAPCPCGSGKKYKQCCIRKDFELLEDDDGNIFKSMPISDEMKAFIAKHGREPGPDDPVFPDMPHFEHMEHQMIELMKKVGIDPAIIYATEKTGQLVTEENQDFLSDMELDEWNAAIEEYEEEHGPRQPPEFPIGTVVRYGPAFVIGGRYDELLPPTPIVLKVCNPRGSGVGVLDVERQLPTARTATCATTVIILLLADEDHVVSGSTRSGAA